MADNSVGGPVGHDDEPRLLREAVPDAMVIVDNGGSIVDVNALAEKLFGAGREALIGAQVEALMPQRFRAEHVAHRQRYAALPCARPMGGDRDLCCLADTGKEIPVEISLNTIDRAGRPLGVATIRETCRREAGARLAQRTSQMQAALDSITEGFVLFDRDDKLVFCNEAYRNIVAPASDRIRPGASFETVTRTMIESQAALFPGETVEEQVAERMSRHREHPNTLEVERPHSALAGRTPAEAYAQQPPGDMMDKPLRALPTSPQAQQQQKEDRSKGFLAA